MTYDLAEASEPVEWNTERLMRNTRLWEEKPSKKMFLRLFSYLQGANKLSRKMKMTVPVWSKMTLKVCSRGFRFNYVILNTGWKDY